MPVPAATVDNEVLSVGRAPVPAWPACGFCRGIVVLALALALSACSPRMALLRGAADQLAGQGRQEEEDLGLARDAAAFYLKLSEALLREIPDHLPLVESVAGGFTQYAYAFVAFEADRTESTDARAAQVLRQRAARLYGRAQRHALAALEARQPGFAKALAAPTSLALRLAPDEVAVAYWGAASWGAHIALSKDKPEIVADLPLAIRLAQLAYATEPGHGQGALALLMAQLELARPGGSSRQAEVYLARAEAAAGGASAPVLLTRAESMAQPAGDRAEFERLLRQALTTAGNRRDLTHQVMRARAQWLLDTIDDQF